VIDPATKAGAHAARRLEHDLVLWLTTVTPAGQPQASPVWFLWHETEILVFSRGDTPRAANIRANPRVAASFDSDGDGGDVVSLEGEARIVRERATVVDVPPAYIDKYAKGLAENGWTMATMLVDYPVEIRVQVTRVRAW
jgi:PPOX class probable F420-dependent enzyme